MPPTLVIPPSIYCVSAQTYPQFLAALCALAKTAVLAAMNATKSRDVIWGNRLKAAKADAEHARKRAFEAAREADRAEALAWSIRMEGYGGPAQPSPTIAQCLNGGYGWLEVKCHRCETKASIPLDAIWKLEPSLKCRSCREGRHAPHVHMIRLTEQREITPYVWVRTMKVESPFKQNGRLPDTCI